MQASSQLDSLVTPAAVLELAQRLRAADAVVRDLAATSPVGLAEVEVSETVTDLVSRCTLCGRIVAATNEPGEHEPICPWRRAVEANEVKS